MENSARVGLSSGFVATRRAIQLVPSRQPLRHPLFDRLVEYWPLAEQNEKRLGLILGKKPAPNTGTLDGRSGLGSLCSNFGGAGAGFLQVASDADLQLGNNDWTISAWVNTSLTGVGQQITGKDDGASAREYIFRLGAANNGISQMFDGTSTSKSIVTSSNTLGTNAWHHVTGIHTAGSPGSMSIIADGTLTVGASDSAAIGTTATNFTIGGDMRSSNSAGFGGQIMRLGIWKRKLTTDEVAYLYNGGMGRDFPWL